jgi:hypothetical protein
MKPIRLFAVLALAMSQMAVAHAQFGLLQPQLPNQREGDSLSCYLGLVQGASCSNNCKPNMAKVEAYLERLPYIVDKGSPRKDQLVSNYAFSKAVRDDFTKLVLGWDNLSKLNRYATLDLSNKPAFDFTPLTWYSDIGKGPFTTIIGLNFSGKLDGESVFKIKDIRDLTANVSFVRLLDGTHYKPKAGISQIRDNLECRFERRIAELAKKYETEFDEVCNQGCFSDLEERDKKSSDIKKKFLDDFTTMEIEETTPYWRSRNFWWITLNLGIKRDRVSFLPQSLLDAKDYSPKAVTVFTPELEGALNHFEVRSNGASLLKTIWIGVRQKHSLSTVYTPEDFQPFHKVNDSVYQLRGNEALFITSFDELDKKITLDYGARVVGMSPYWGPEKRRQVGLSLAFSRMGLVNEAAYPSLFRSEAGIVIPFLKEDGVSRFNLEVFRRWNIYSNFPVANEKLWGVRFNIPISSR